MDKWQVIAVLNRSALSVEHAVTALQAEQTADERRSGATVHRNGRGWNAREAYFGKSLADRLAKGLHLTPAQLACARKMCIGHATQLANLGTFDLIVKLGIAEGYYRPIRVGEVEHVECFNAPWALKNLIADYDPFLTGKDKWKAYNEPTK